MTKALTIELSTTEDMLLALIAKMSGGTGAPMLVIYKGVMPTNVNTALSGNASVATLLLSDPAAAANDNEITFSDFPKLDLSADSSGTATFYRIHQSDGVTPGLAVIQGTVGLTTDFDLRLNTTTFVAEGPVQIAELRWRLPG